MLPLTVLYICISHVLQGFLSVLQWNIRVDVKMFRAPLMKAG